MHSDPKTKEQFLDRVLSYDFEGDFSEIGQERAQIRRTSPHRFMVKFPASGQHFEVVIRKPRITTRRRTRKPTEPIAKQEPKRRIQNRLKIRA